MNSHAENLKDVVGFNALNSPSSLPIEFILSICILLCIMCLFFYYQYTKTISARLENLKRRIENNSLLPRTALHELAHTINKTDLDKTKIHQLSTLRFSANTPNKEDVILIINDIKKGVKK